MQDRGIRNEDRNQRRSAHSRAGPSSVEPQLRALHLHAGPGRDGTVPGLGLHLRRLVTSSAELFGHPVDADGVRSLLRRALQDAPTAVSVRINLFPASSSDADEPEVMITIGPPAAGASDRAWQVRTVLYERELAHIKHVGFFGVIHQRRLAQAAGYDDPLFHDRQGQVSEGAIWNLCLFNGQQFVFPEASVLPGITMQLLIDGLERLGLPYQTRPVSVEELPGYRAAYATNTALPIQPIDRIDQLSLPGDARGTDMLTTAWRQIMPEPI